MVLILSYDEWDSESEYVSRWIKKLGGHFVRMNANNFLDKSGRFSYSLYSEEMTLKTEETVIDLDLIDTIWLRRWGNPSSHFSSVSSYRNLITLNDFAEREWNTFTSHLFYLLRHKRWVTSPLILNENKLTSLSVARKAGLSVPEYIVTNAKEELMKFRSKHQKVVTKVMSNFHYLSDEQEVASVFTELVDDGKLEKIPDFFYPSLFQQCIDKVYEVRVFCVGGSFFPTAVIPMNDNVEVDIKKGIKSDRISNRYMPYQLPSDLEEKLNLFLASLDYDTCSIDLIRSKRGEYVFLEVNPIGKFMYYSQCCNYNLEKKVAEFLLKNQDKQ